jgi:Co/Zn/Cd efflux system component
LLLGTLVVWLLVGLFWYFTTLHYHPYARLARTVTVSLVIAYATTVYLNHLLFIPRFWRANRWPAYWGSLLATMVGLTMIAVAIIRVSHIRSLGPDPNPNGLYVHFAIDFAGMVGHVFAAAGVVWLWHRFIQRPPTT